MEKLTVYGRTVPPCSSCDNLKTLLDVKEVDYEYKDISVAENFEAFCKYRLRALPAVFEGINHLGGLEEVKQLLKGV